MVDFHATQNQLVQYDCRQWCKHKDGGGYRFHISLSDERCVADIKVVLVGDDVCSPSCTAQFMTLFPNETLLAVYTVHGYAQRAYRLQEHERNWCVW